MKKFNRLIIYPKDVQIITGRSLAHARLLLKALRADLGKKNKDLVTIQEFCIYTNLNYDEVFKILNS